MKSIFTFDTMLTTKIITFVYWLLLLGVVINALNTMFGGYYNNFLGGIGILVGGAIGARISCELMIVLFKINDNLQKVVNKQETEA